MNPEKPQTPPEMDELLAKARQEADVKKPLDASAEMNQSAETAKGGIDDLLAEIKTEKVDVVEQPAPVEEGEKLKEDFEKIKPEVEKLAELLITEKQLDNGKMDYAALTNNASAYVEARKDDTKRDIAVEKLYRSVEPELGNSPRGYDRMKLFDLIKENTSKTVLRSILSYREYFDFYVERKNEAALDFWEKGRDDVSPKSAALGYMSEITRRLSQGLDVDPGAKGKIENPDEYVEGLWRGYRRTVDLSKKRIAEIDADRGIPGGNFSFEGQRQLIIDRAQEAIDGANDGGTDSRAEGFAFAALEAGDVDVAAKALAFANGIKPLDAKAVAQIGEKLKKLEPGMRKQFATIFDQERNKKREYAFVDVNGRNGYEVKA